MYTTCVPWRWVLEKTATIISIAQQIMDSISFICHFMNESNALCILIIIGLIDKWMLAHATIIIMKC